MQFSLLDFEKNDTWRYELHPPHLINDDTLPCDSQHYLVTVKTPNMHVNTTSAYNANYKNAVTCIKLH